MIAPAHDLDTHTAALAWHDAGCCVVRVKTDGTKAVVGTWKHYQSERPSRETVDGWFNGGYPGLGIITGSVSGNLEMFELEGRAIDEGLMARLTEAALANGLADLWRRVTTGGYMEMTPSGGVHLLYRVLAPVPGNTKLARRPATDSELQAWKATENAKLADLDEDKRDARAAKIASTTREQVTQVLIETRGEGGFVVIAPSNGPVHPTNKPWIRAVGNATTIPDLTPDEHQALHRLAGTLDQMPAFEPPPARTPQPPTSEASRFLLGGHHTPDGGLSPGDDYEARTDWRDILEPHGWTLLRQHGRERFWCRPGKTPANRDDTSATTGYGDRGDWLYVFSTSTELPTEQALGKFYVHAQLEHGGDLSAAARALRAAGYGTPPPEQPRPANAQGPTAPEAGEAEQAAGTGTTVVPAATTPPVAEPTHYSRTDDGNALQLKDLHQHEIRYCSDRGSWLAWDGHRWRWDHAGAVHEHARRLARNLPVGTKEQDKHRAWTLSARGLRAMVKVAETDGHLTVRQAQLDSRPYELNTPGGVVDLRTGLLRPPDPGALHTRSTTVAPDYDAEPTRWLRFLADTFAGDEAMTTYVQRLLGVALVGQVLEQVLPFAFGEGANGKTTLLGTVMRLLGLGDEGYALTAPADILLASAQNRHTTELARLSGARLVVTSELEDGQRFAEAKVKQLTGGDPITARFMRQDDFTFRPTHSLWLLANHAPEVRAGGTAFWRRIKQIAFLHVVPQDKRDPHLEDRLVEQEGPAILAWLIAGAATYAQQGIAEPASVTRATAAYQRDQDTVARFVEEGCELGPHTQQGMTVKVTELRQAYETWCRVEGETPVSAKALTLTLRSRFGVESSRDMTARFYTGVRLNVSDASSDPSGDSDQAGWWQQ